MMEGPGKLGRKFRLHDVGSGQRDLEASAPLCCGEEIIFCLRRSCSSKHYSDPKSQWVPTCRLSFPPWFIRQGADLGEEVKGLGFGLGEFEGPV